MSPNGCQGERSTLASTAPPARLASRWWRPRRVRTGHHPRRFRTRTIADPRRLPSVQSPDLAAEAGSHALPVTFARATPRTLLPTANRPSASGIRSPHEATSPPLDSPFSVPRDHGEDAFTRFLQPTIRHEYPIGPLDSRIAAARRFRPGDGFRSLRLGRNRVEDAIEWRSFDDDPPASASSRVGLPVSRAACPVRTCGP